MSKIIFTVIAWLCSYSLFGQISKKNCPKLIMHSSQLDNTLCDSTLKNILIYSPEKVLIKYKNKTKQYIPSDSIWGILDKNGSMMRMYNGTWYGVKQTSPFVIYTKGGGKYVKTYFSPHPDSSIYPYKTDLLYEHLDSSMYNELKKNYMDTRKELSIMFYGLKTRFAGESLWGAGMDFAFFPKKNWGTGFTASFGGKQTSTNFSLPATKPSLKYFEFGWLNQLILTSGKNIRWDLDLVNGFAYGYVSDRDQLVNRQTRRGRRMVPKLISSSSFYLLQPAAGISLKLIDNKRFSDIYLSSKLRYQWLIGRPRFAADIKQSNYSVGFGLSIIGFDKEPFKK